MITHLLDTLWRFVTADHSQSLSFATLLVTVIAVWIALRAYRNQITMIEPWSLTKIDDDLWILERTSPVIATIDKTWGSRGRKMDDRIKVEFFVDTGTTDKCQKVFKKGTREIIKISNSYTGGYIDFWYQDYKNEKQLFRKWYGKLLSSSRSGKLNHWRVSVY